MARFLAGRLVAAVPVLFGVTVLAFAMLHLIPGDPILLLISGFEASSGPEVIARAREKFGLNDPLPVQYLHFVQHAFQGDLGTSILKSRPVGTLIAEALPWSIQLAGTAVVLAVIIGVTLGVISAMNRNTWLDSLSIFSSLFAVSMPDFWLAILAILVISVKLRWLPSSGTEGVNHLILPALVLGARSAGSIARLTRSSMLEVLSRPYIMAARAKGLAAQLILVRHALKNALIPVVTLIGLDLGRLLGGTVVVETIFARQGLGKLLIDSILDKDFPVLQGTVLFVAGAYVLINLAVDLSYAWLDPRIRYA
ncbi:MAG TPA: ABC transporter permease [Chloroflexota bacterium]|nr:ABC transporter permease [Chloroflexota bacterium]